MLVSVPNLAKRFPNRSLGSLLRERTQHLASPHVAASHSRLLLTLANVTKRAHSKQAAQFVGMPKHLRLSIRPKHLCLPTEEGHPRGAVVQVDHLGKDVQVQLDCDTFRLTTVVGADCCLRPGDTVT